MREYVYDERLFPEYEQKLVRGRRRILSSAATGILAYAVAFPLVLFVLAPQASQTQRLQGALLLLLLPLFFIGMGWYAYWFNRRNPLRIGRDRLLMGAFEIRFEDIMEIIWLETQKRAVLMLDPRKYRLARKQIDGEDLLRPDEFLSALEGKVRITKGKGSSTN